MISAMRCEACGYDLAWIEVEGVCPECARPVAQNNRDRRGSAWQRRPSLDAWLITGLQMCVRPRAFWQDVELEFPRTWNLLVVNVVFAAMAAGVGSAAGAELVRPAGAWFGGLLLGVPLFVVMFLLTMLCMAIVRLMTPDASRMVVRTAVAHAAFLWLLAGPVCFVAMAQPALALLLVIPVAAVVRLGAAGARGLRYAPEPVA